MHSAPQLPSLRNQSVRDLAWCCFGHNLIEDYGLHDAPDVKACHIQLTSQRLSWLLSLDDQPSQLNNYIENQTSTRLGHYFECLWQFFIDNDSELTLTAANLTIYDNKRSIGEFDIIYYDKTLSRHYHLELALKFYLHTGKNTPGLEAWMGPNCIDQFQLKLDRLLTHQIQLGSNSASQKPLLSLGIETLHKEIAIMGRLFYPFEQTQAMNSLSASPYVSPYVSPSISPSHSKGHWCHLGSFINEAVFDDLSWVVLERGDWISPLSQRVITVDTATIRQTVSQHIHRHGRPIMIAQVESHDGIITEIDRLFITADHWPDKDKGIDLDLDLESRS